MAIRTVKTRVRQAKGRRLGSTLWLQRQLNDPYVQRAQKEGYRSRSAYKLLEIDQKHHLLKRGTRVLDLGCAPGGWTQVALRQGCQVVGVDLVPVQALDGATLLQVDITSPQADAQILAALGGPADLVLSDIAPSSTGQRAVDRLRSEAMGEAVLSLLPRLLVPGGHLLMKLVRGADASLVQQARRNFASVKLLRPDATRRESSEIYLLAQLWRPYEEDNPPACDSA